MAKAETIKFDTYEVIIDPENLRFDERTLTSYIQTEGGHYDNIGAYLALAERHLQNSEVKHEKMYSQRFVEAKEEGSSDKLAEARAKCDTDVNELKSDIVEAKYIVNRLKNHVKAWDKSHDNAQSLGHMLRKQMDKLNGDIYGNHGFQQNHDEVKQTSSAVEEKSGEFESNLGLENIMY
jgi:hypothetical protein